MTILGLVSMVGQDLQKDTIVVFDSASYSERVSIVEYSKDAERPRISLSIYDLSVNLDRPNKSKIDRDSLIHYFDEGFLVHYGNRLIADKVLFRSIRIFNNDDVQVRSIDSMIGLTAVDIKGYLKYATRIELSDPFISIRHLGKSVPLELSVNLF